MKQTIVVVLTVLIVATPCLAQEEEPIKTIEGTVWSYEAYRSGSYGGWRTHYIAFHDGCKYHQYDRQSECFIPNSCNPVAYIDLPGISLFWYKRRCFAYDLDLLCQWQTGVLFPLIGYGIQWCILTPCPLVRNTLELVPDMSLPEDICP